MSELVLCREVREAWGCSDGREDDPGTAVRGPGEEVKVLAVRLSSSAASDQLDLFSRTRGRGVGRERGTRRELPVEVEVSELEEEDREREGGAVSARLELLSTGNGEP